MRPSPLLNPLGERRSKRKVVVVMRERGGETLPFVFRSEAEAVAKIAAGARARADDLRAEQDAIIPVEVSITRSSVTNENDALKNDRTMGRKHIVPYGLYRAHGFISGRLANDGKKGTGFSDDDLAIFWEALANMFDHDRAAARGEMAARELIVFKHDSDLGNASAHRLFERVTVSRKGTATAPRAFSDYVVAVDEAELPTGVTVERRI